jgi:hypothetical protein
LPTASPLRFGLVLPIIIAILIMAFYLKADDEKTMPWPDSDKKRRASAKR